MIDFKRSTTLAELQQNISELYFPNGLSREQGLHVNEMRTRLATFNGQILPEILDNGQPFTVEGFYNQVKRSPVRIYLETINGQSDNADVGNNIPVPKCVSSNELSINIMDELPDIHNLSDNADVGNNIPLPNSNNELSINIMDELPDINNMSDDEFLSSPPCTQGTNQREPNPQMNQSDNRYVIIKISQVYLNKLRLIQHAEPTQALSLFPQDFKIVIILPVSLKMYINMEQSLYSHYKKGIQKTLCTLLKSVRKTNCLHHQINGHRKLTMVITGIPVNSLQEVFRYLMFEHYPMTFFYCFNWYKCMMCIK